jgi:hypothetical protein
MRLARRESRDAHGFADPATMTGMRPTLAAAFAALTWLAACSSNATSDGGTGTTTGGTTTGGTTGGAPYCINYQCMNTADCCAGTVCGVHGVGCCLADGQPCTNPTDCCNTSCNLVSGLCTNPYSTSTTSSGTTSGGATTGGSSSGSTTSGTTSAGSTTGSTQSNAVSFSWTFNGTQSCEQAAVGWIEVIGFAGLPAQFVPCRGSDGVAGTTFSNLTLGSTSYNLIAYAAGTSRAIYGINGTVTVTSGTTPVAAVLLFEGNPTGSNLTFQWTFNGGASACTSGLIDGGVQLSVQSDAGFSGLFSCTASGAAGTYSTGSYPYAIAALLGDGGIAYSASGNATVNGITDTTILADLAPPSASGSQQGNLIATMTFGGQSCVATTADTLHFSLRDSSGLVAGSGNNDSSSPCVDSAGTLGGTHYFSAIAAGTYWLEVTGIDTSGVTAMPVDYFTGQVTVSPGYTASVSADASPHP